MPEYSVFGDIHSAMTSTTQAILRSIATSDTSLSVAEQDMLQRLADGRTEATTARPLENMPLLLTQKQAARVLGLSRVTLWRMTNEGIFKRVEITPANFRYRREEIEAVAREGRNVTLPPHVGRPRIISRA